MIKLEKSKIEQEIQQEMKDHEVAFIGDRKITWKKLVLKHLA